MTKNQYHMDGTETLIHQLINDSRVTYEVLELDEVVKDLGRLNWIVQEMNKSDFDLKKCIEDFRKNLLYHMENI